MSIRAPNVFNKKYGSSDRNCLDINQYKIDEFRKHAKIVFYLTSRDAKRYVAHHGEQKLWLKQWFSWFWWPWPWPWSFDGWYDLDTHRIHLAWGPPKEIKYRKSLRGSTNKHYVTICQLVCQMCLIRNMGAAIVTSWISITVHESYHIHESCNLSTGHMW